MQLKKKMFHANPHTAYYALLALECIVKNCGQPVHEEVTNKTSCEMFQQLVNTTTHENVKNKMLELIQTWAHAFRSNYKYCAIKDTMNILKCEGHKFPELKEADAMFVADVAPEWADGEVCHRCRVTFSIMQRKHHCRNCGQVFCAQCSSKVSRLPKFGIEKEVRVCDGCFISIQKPSSGSSNSSTSTKKGANDDELPEEYLKSSLAQQSQQPPSKTEQEIQEEEELQLALALSQSEAEQKAAKSYNVPRQSYTKSPSPEPTKRSPSPVEQITDPELARYLNRSYWEAKKQEIKQESPLSPTAPSPMSSIASSIPARYGPEDPEIDDLATMMRGQLDMFVNRMKSNSARGRDISNDTAIQSFFLSISSLHAKLMTYIKDLDDKRMWYESLQDKIAQIRDSRAALDVLRQEHQEKLRRAAEEAERQRQIQMAQKLEIMRKKKQEYLQYQRQLAFQRIQEQEREMHLRQEQQKARYQMGGGFQPYMPGGVPGGPGPQDSPMMSGQFGPGPAFNYPPAPGTIPQQPPGPVPGHQAPQVGPPQPQMFPGNYPPQPQNNFNNFPPQAHPPPQGMNPGPGFPVGQIPNQTPAAGFPQVQAPPPPQVYNQPEQGMNQQQQQHPAINLQPPGQQFPPGMAPQGLPPQVIQQPQVAPQEIQQPPPQPAIKQEEAQVGELISFD